MNIKYEMIEIIIIFYTTLFVRCQHALYVACNAQTMWNLDILL